MSTDEFTCLARVLAALLSEIHGDRGEYTNAHGVYKSTQDALTKLRMSHTAKTAIAAYQGMQNG